MGLSLKIKIPSVVSKKRPSQKSAGQKPPGEGSSRKNAEDHRTGGPPSPCHLSNPESRTPKPYIVEPTTRNYNTYILEPKPYNSAPPKPQVIAQTTTTTPSSHPRRRRSSISIRSPPGSSYRYVEIRHRRSFQSIPSKCPVSPLGTSRFEYPPPWSRPEPAVQRDEHGFSIYELSTPSGQRNEFGMSALAPVNSDEFNYFEQRVGGEKEEEKEKGKSGWIEDDLYGHYSYGGGDCGGYRWEE